MATFTRKPQTVEAHRWSGEGHESIPSYLAAWEVAVNDKAVDAHCGKRWDQHAVTTDTAHRIVCPGQWAVHEQDGEVHVMEDDAFHAGYEQSAEQSRKHVG